MTDQTTVISFIKEVLKPEKYTIEKNSPALGKTFTSHTRIRQMIYALSGKPVNAKTTVLAELDASDELSQFYIFILVVHQYFNDHSKKITAEFETKVNALAKALGIAAENKLLLIEFFTHDTPYTDRNRAVYFNNEKIVSNIKYIGTNILHAAKRNSDIAYLKYFETYNLFLSKTFLKNKNPYHFFENISTGEVNIVNATNYLMDTYGHTTFTEIVESVKSHLPFQYFELAGTVNTPRIVLDPEQSKIIISGSSSPFSPTNFFEPIHEWLDHYAVLRTKPLQVFIMLEYFNTYTSKFLLRLCRQCDTLAKEGKNIRIYWYFDPEDSDMRDFGEHLAGIYKKGFEYCLITDGVEELI